MSEESHSLIAASSGALLPVKSKGNVAAILAKEGTGFLPFMTLLQTSSKLTGPPKSMKAGNFVLTENGEHVDLGDEVDLMILGSRLVAWKYNTEESLRIYNDEDPVFIEIQEKSLLSQQQLEADGDSSTYSWGAEFLIYLPGQEKCATFFCNSKSSRRAAGEELVEHEESHALITLTNLWVDPPKSKHAWFVFKAELCQTADQYGAVDIDMLNKTIEKFNKVDEVESVTAEEVEDQ